MTRMDLTVDPIRGEYRIRKEGRRRDASYGTFSRAEAAAIRLVTANPGDTFVITQEVARVRRRGEGR
jgi:hypothetical protein